MNIAVDIEIEKPKEIIWSAITDIENCRNMISGIIDLSILSQPTEGIVGLKWRETRLMFGKEADEIMWITESVENEYYMTRAESHGSVYITKLSLTQTENNSILTMSFSGVAQTMTSKILSTCMAIFIKGSLKKALRNDLEDIKRHVEQRY